MAKKVGRPPKYKTVEELQTVIDAYFKSCDGEMLKDDEDNLILDKYGHPVFIHVKPPTVTGLALALGFNSRQTLLNYQGKRQFMDTITRAKARCEEYTETRLYDRDGAMGAKFSLTNNFKGWRDRPVEDDQDTLEHLDNILKALNTNMKQDDNNGT
jgi:hypothetical protein